MKKLLVALVLVLGLGGIGALDPSPVLAASTDPGVVTDTLAGAYAAIGCGLFGRALGSGLVCVGTIAGAVATCGFMFFDAMFL